jgi:hypothetical protein
MERVPRPAKEGTVAATASINIGFLTVLHESNGYTGGYLLTNNWGRPLEFRLSTAVQPSKVQQILYGPTLRSYICADLIGKTLVEKTTLQPQLVLTDTEAVLELRERLDVPVGWVMSSSESDVGTIAIPAKAGRGPVVVHPRHADDAACVKEMLARTEGVADLAEPFCRIREAMTEARKSGVSRAA